MRARLGMLPENMAWLVVMIVIPCGLVLFSPLLAASPCSDCTTKYASQTKTCKSNDRACKDRAKAARDAGYRRCERTHQSDIGIRACKDSYRILHERDKAACKFARNLCLADAKAGKTACKIANCNSPSTPPTLACCGASSPALCSAVGHTWSYSRNCCTH